MSMVMSHAYMITPLHAAAKHLSLPANAARDWGPGRLAGVPETIDMTCSEL
jgi:hypothetical protein